MEEAAAFHALDANDKLRLALRDWREQHQRWQQTFPPNNLDDLQRPGAPPSLGHLKITAPSNEQQAAYDEANTAKSCVVGRKERGAQEGRKEGTAA